MPATSHDFGWRNAARRRRRKLERSPVVYRCGHAAQKRRAIRWRRCAMTAPVVHGRGSGFRARIADLHGRDTAHELRKERDLALTVRGDVERVAQQLEHGLRGRARRFVDRAGRRRVPKKAEAFQRQRTLAHRVRRELDRDFPQSANGRDGFEQHELAVMHPAMRCKGKRVDRARPAVDGSDLVREVGPAAVEEGADQRALALSRGTCEEIRTILVRRDSGMDPDQVLPGQHQQLERRVVELARCPVRLDGQRIRGIRRADDPDAPVVRNGLELSGRCSRRDRGSPSDRAACATRRPPAATPTARRRDANRNLRG